MRVLLLGWSSIARRRVVPALERLDECSRVDVASRRGKSVVEASSKLGRVYDDFGAALAASDADVVYVSTANDEHAALARAAIEVGKHVVVDKPAVLGESAAIALAEAAKARGVCFAEALVFGFHPQIAALRAVFPADAPPLRATATFTMPPLPPGGFRYRAAAGGGAMWDLGPYALGIGRLLFGAFPERVSAEIASWSANGEVDTAFSVLLGYAGGRTVVGQLGFDTEYRNEVVVLGAGASARLERVFTTPPDASATIHVREQNVPRDVDVPPADSFAAFFREVFASIRAGEASRWGDEAVASARALDALRAAAGGART